MEGDDLIGGRNRCFDGVRITDKAYGPDRSVLPRWGWRNEQLKTLIKNFDLHAMRRSRGRRRKHTAVFDRDHGGCVVVRGNAVSSDFYVLGGWNLRLGRWRKVCGKLIGTSGLASEIPHFRQSTTMLRPGGLPNLAREQP